MDIPEAMWTTAAYLHMDDNAEKWMQVYKKKHGTSSWTAFMQAVQHKFGAYDYKHAVDELLELQQLGSVEDYVTEFEALQFQLTMHDQGMGETYFVSQFIKGLKPEIRYQVQGQVRENMQRAVMLAKIQHTIHERRRYKSQRPAALFKPTSTTTSKSELRQQPQQLPLTRERKLRDYCRANNLCFYCREPYDPNHAAKCSKRTKSQVNALVLNDLDVHLTDDIFNQLAIEDTLNEEFGSLSLNALAGTDMGEALRLRASVNKKVMLLLVDSGSSHCFVSSTFLKLVGISPIPATPKQVRVANGSL
jgi:hypothetical protein